MKIIGLTGNSGSGKTAAARILAKHKALIIDADRISHDLLLFHKEAITEVVQCFGDEILDDAGHINRKRLGVIVFENQAKLDLLMEITHKYIIEEILNQIKLNACNPEYNYIVIDAPLLIEAGLHEICNWVLVIAADEKVRLERVTKRDGISPEKVLKRFQKQTPEKELAPFADKIIRNNGSFEDLNMEIIRFLEIIEKH